MRYLPLIFALGLLALCAGCGDTSSQQTDGQGAGSTAAAQPSPTTFKGVSTGYEATDQR